MCRVLWGIFEMTHAAYVHKQQTLIAIFSHRLQKIQDEGRKQASSS